MGKKMLLGLGVVAGACFMVSKKLTEEQREKIAMKVDEIILTGATRPSSMTAMRANSLRKMILAV